MRTRKILIAGGGIGGLATAISLLRHGFDVEVYEQAAELREFGAGIQISPNGNRALDALGVFEPLARLATNADSKEIRLWNSGKTWTLFDLGDAAVRKYGYPYLTVFRPDLLRVLADEVRRLQPDAIRVGARCVGVTQDARSVTLDFEDGRRASGDALVGADGVHTRIRRALFGPDDVLFSGMVAWRALIPMDALPARFARSVAVNWVGPGGHLVHYPVQAGRMMNFVGTLEGNTWTSAPWSTPATRDECAAAFAGWHEDIQTMLAHAPSVTKWALCGRAFLDTWSRGRATLVGDACHPTLPFLAQGAVSTIEDAVVLGRCLAADDDVAAALTRYDAVRRPHAYRMVRGAADNTSRFHNPALADPAEAEAFVSREWQSQAISDRYDWLFTYDAARVDLDAADRVPSIAT
ncbi:FAD-dependent monooxygenase [Aromatoleum toluclasticum]|uniref:FAD-dependent monooxygenase n=1 Tax=Aromatoleum toluclasticum TaxID=92003 RepID=UPI0003727497|nr:FAD-dependent monooxygenase [Aromatoleum toluclasticum]